MLLSLLLMAGLGVQTPPPRPVGSPATQEAPAVAVPSQTEAAALAEAGDREGALRAFQQIALANPQDHHARLWIARLHVEMRHPDRAESVYRSVLLEDPSNLEAMLGVGTTLIARHEYKAAIDVLGDAEKVAPQNPDVLAALGRAYAESGHTGRSIGYWQRAVAVAPSTENRMSLERARSMHDHRFETRGIVEQFDGNVPDTRETDLTVNVRLSDAFRISGRGQLQEKFNRTDKRGGGGVEWRWNRSTTLLAQGLAGPDNRVLPQKEAYVEIAHARGPARLTLGYRYLDFFGARASIVGPTVTWWAADRVAIDLRSALVVTESTALTAVDKSPSAALRGSYRLYPRMWLAAGYARGIESFDAVSIDRIGAFRANTASGGVRIDLPTVTSILIDYDHQWRPVRSTMRRLSVSLTQRF